MGGKAVFRRFAGWLNRSLSRRLICIYGLCLALALVSVLFTLYVYATNTLRQTNERSAERQLGLLAKELEDRLKVAESSTQAVAAYQKLHDGEVVKGFDKFTLNLLNQYPKDICYGIYFAYEDLPYNHKLACPGADRRSGITPLMEYDFHKNCEWYEKPKKTGAMSYSEPYFDAGGSNITMVSVTMPVYSKSGKLVGVAGTDVSLESMQKMLAETRLLHSGSKGQGKSDYLFLVSESGRVISHPNAKLQLKEGSEGKLVAEIPGGKAIASSKEGTEHVKDGTVPSTFFWKTMPDSGWKLCAAVPDELLVAGSAEIRSQCLLIGAIAMVILSIVVLWTSNRISAPLRELAGIAESVSQGDVSQEPKPRKHADEIGQISHAFASVIHYQRSIAEAAQKFSRGELNVDIELAGPNDALGIAFNGMKERLISLVHGLSERSRTVSEVALKLLNSSLLTAETAQTVTNRLESVESATSLLKDRSQAIALENERLSRESVESTKNMEELNSAIESVRMKIKDQQQAARRFTEAAEEGKEAVQMSIDGINAMDSSIVAASEAVSRLTAKQLQIGTIVDTISDISGQTNLLALNAAIEAARAGEHGKGFAVVADEVKKLANRSAEAARQVQDLIKEVRTDIDSSTEAMSASQVSVKQGIESVNQVIAVLKQIADMSWTVIELANSSAELVEEMEAQSNQVADQLEKVKDTSIVTCESATVLSNTANELEGTIEQVSSSHAVSLAQSNEVHQLAEELQELAAELDMVEVLFGSGQSGPAKMAA